MYRATTGQYDKVIALDDSELIVRRINILQFVKKLQIKSVECEYKHIGATEPDNDATIQNASEYPGILGRIAAAG